MAAWRGDRVNPRDGDGDADYLSFSLTVEYPDDSVARWSAFFKKEKLQQNTETLNLVRKKAR